jgi:Mrp family chromosome partitioning ATPase
LKMDNSAGLAELLAGQIEVDQAIRSTSVEKLSFISAGALPPNPAELLGSERMHELLQQLRQRFEFIFIDSSPLLAVSDAIFLSTMVDGSLLVVNRNTPKPLVKKARARLSVPQAKIVGMLLNRVDIRNNEYGGYYKQYDTYYGADSSNGSALLPNGNGTASTNGHAAHENGNDKSSRRLRQKQNTREAHKPNNPNGHSINGHVGERPTRVLDVVRVKFCQTMGPMGMLVFKDHVRALGGSPESLPPDRLPELVDRLSKEIFEKLFRRQFEEEMAREIERSREHRV